MKKIPLSGKVGNGKVALVDNCDFKEVSKIKWYLAKNGYAYHSFYNKVTKEQIHLSMHRYLMKEKGVDHINRNKLDNRRENLRICPISINAFNTPTRVATSQFRGVFYVKANNVGKKRWAAQINILPNKRKHLGYFMTELEAAEAYNKMATYLLGKYATLNDI